MTHRIPLARTAIPTLYTAVLAACGGAGDSYVPQHVGGYPPPSSGAPEADYAMAEEAADEGAPAMYAAEPSAQAYAPGAPQPYAAAQPQWNTEQYDAIVETGFRAATDEPLSTFSVDVDTASYSNLRRFLAYGQRPPPDAVRIEELINYFGYDYAEPEGEHPVAITSELADSPFGDHRKLLRIGLLARDRAAERQPAKNLVFLLDVSGSMSDENKLPLLKQALSLLIEQLQERDSIAIVAYAGASGVVLPPTPGDRRREIEAALHALSAGGSTNGASGIELAYDLAAQRLRPGAVNRVILATDGDFNVGVTDRGSLTRLIERRRKQGIFLTVLGFGMGNLKDATMEMLADKGNGNYAYIDTLNEARKVLVHDVNATLRTVAKDTKIQVEWNPALVARYRLIGYDNRRLAAEDFNDDAKDAGDMGDGHRVTALYEIELAGNSGGTARPAVDALKYQAPRALSREAGSSELATIKLRYKRPDERESRLLSQVVRGRAHAFEQASDDMRFAAAVAGFGMLLRQSAFAGSIDLERVERIAQGALGRDELGYRRELVELVRMARGAQLAR